MAPTTTGKQPSGKYWVTWANANAKNSDKLEDLEPDFRKKVEAFIQALKDAGADGRRSAPPGGATSGRTCSTGVGRSA